MMSVINRCDVCTWMWALAGMVLGCYLIFTGSIWMLDLQHDANMWRGKKQAEAEQKEKDDNEARWKALRDDAEVRRLRTEIEKTIEANHSLAADRERQIAERKRIEAINLELDKEIRDMKASKTWSVNSTTVEEKP